jgi:ABC-type multidrug transport system permease subunit
MCRCLLVVHTLCAIALGMAVAASVPTVQIGQVLGPLFIVIFLLFGGNLANASSVTWILRWIQYTSLIFYCYQGLISSQLQGQTFNGVPGEYYLGLYDLNQFSWYASTGAMLGLTVVFLVIGYVALRISTRPRMKLV